MTKTRDPATELTDSLYSTLRVRWKALEDARRTGPQSLVDTCQAALNLTLDACSAALGEDAEPRPAVRFTLDYPG